MRNPRFLIFLLAVLAFFDLVARADAPHAMPLVNGTSACFPAPSGSVVKPHRHVSGRAPVSEIV